MAKEYYDTLIRNERHLLYCLNYIKKNPQYLADDKYEYYIHPSLDHQKYPHP